MYVCVGTLVYVGENARDQAWIIPQESSFLFSETWILFDLALPEWTGAGDQGCPCVHFHGAGVTSMHQYSCPQHPLFKKNGGDQIQVLMLIQ